MGLNIPAIGNTHRENGAQKHVTNTQGLKPIAMKKAAFFFKAISLVLFDGAPQNTAYYYILQIIHM